MMIFSLLLLALTNSHSALAEQSPSDELKRGAKVYNSCFHCHSLRPGMHLTGPSLAGIFGKKAGTVEGYSRYSDALKKSSITWDEETLFNFITKPEKLVPGNHMTFSGFSDKDTVKALVKFIQLASAENAAKKIKGLKLGDDTLMEGQQPKELESNDPKFRIKSIEKCKDTYKITTTDGKSKLHWERNISFKFLHDSRLEAPVIEKTGSLGDRLFVMLADPSQLMKFLRLSCKF